MTFSWRADLEKPLYICAYSSKEGKKVSGEGGRKGLRARFLMIEGHFSVKQKNFAGTPGCAFREGSPIVRRKSQGRGRSEETQPRIKKLSRNGLGEHNSHFRIEARSNVGSKPTKKTQKKNTKKKKKPQTKTQKPHQQTTAFVSGKKKR